jgi:UDP-glucuronate 4-epimerase
VSEHIALGADGDVVLDVRAATTTPSSSRDIGRTALVTGAAGFIGSHVTDALLADGWRVTGIDSFDDFYDPMLKVAHVDRHHHDPFFEFHNLDIRDKHAMLEIGGDFDVVIHLAALAGVRPSAQRPHEYCEVNINGTANVLSFIEQRQVPRLVFASSSSIYGVNDQVPWVEGALPMPISVYATTKLAGEAMVRHATEQSDLSAVSFRFFTVFGPRQRPDLAITNFAAKMIEGRPIQVYGDGTALRDFTFVDDIVSGVKSGVSWNERRYDVFNLARGERVQLMDVVRELEAVLGVKADIQFQDRVVGDVPQTWGSIDRTSAELGYSPSTSLAEGIRASREWFEAVARSRAAALAS